MEYQVILTFQDCIQRIWNCSQDPATNVKKTVKCCLNMLNKIYALILTDAQISRSLKSPTR